MGMKLKLTVAALSAALTMGSASVLHGALAAEVSSHPPSAKRQLVTCMTKRMSDSKSISYNDATKLCKGQLAAQRVILTTNVLAKPMVP